MIYRRFYSLLFLFALTAPFVNAQKLAETLVCGQDQLAVTDRQQDLQDSLERTYQLSQFRGAESSVNSSPPYVLPVVVHIIHDNGNENLSTTRVLQGIEFLNQSFANTDYYDQQTGMNTQIQFCLAQRTPDNLPTNGITYHQSPLTNITSISDDLPMKDLARWDPSQYINIYVVRDICTSSCGVAGYAYYPSAHGLPMDGIVMEARWLGLNEAGNSVLTHEMGHSLGLAHTFDNGCENDDCLVDGDRVCDTPPDQSTVAVPCGGSVNSCTTDTNSGFATDQNDMFNNYMDYGNFNCYNALTQGQAERMYFFIEGIRRSLLNSPACLTPCPGPVTAGFDQLPAGTSFEVGQTVNFTNTSANGSGFSWHLNGVLQSNAADWNLLLASPGNYQIKLLAAGNPPLCRADSITVNIQAFCLLDANYTADNQQPELGQEVNFAAPGGSVDTYEWTVNSAVESNGNSLQYLFGQAGIYEVCLTVTEGNCSQESCRFYFISSPPPTDDCFGNSNVSLYAYNEGAAVTAGPIISDASGGFWQMLRVDNYMVFQRLNGNGDVLMVRRTEVFSGNFTSFNGLKLLSDGSLLVGYHTGTAGPDRRSYFLRYDPNSDAIVYRNEIGYRGTLYNLVPLPDQMDRYLVLFDFDASETANASNEIWLFDIDAMTGAFSNQWNYQTQQGGPHTITNGYFDQGEFVGIGRIGVTAAQSSFRSGIARFSAPNTLSSLTVGHRPDNVSARLYGQQLIPTSDTLFSIHNGNPTGTSVTNNYWGYLSSWTNSESNWVREFRLPGSRRVIIYAGAADQDALYLLARVFNQDEQYLAVMSTDFSGNLLWANRYDIGAAQLNIAAANGEGRLILTNQNIIIPATLELSAAGSIGSASALLRINLDGSLNDDCVTVTPLDPQISEVDAVAPLFQMNSGSRLKEALPSENWVENYHYQRYTACADTCTISTDSCGLTGDQFSQVWNEGSTNALVQAHCVIADGTGGLLVTGCTETEIFINRLATDGSDQETYTIEFPSGPGIGEIVAVEVTAGGKLLLGGIVPPRSGMNRTAFFTCFDLAGNALDWWQEMDDDAEVMGLHQLENTDEFVLSGSRLWQGSGQNSSILIQRRRISDGELSGNLYGEFAFGDNSDQILSSELIGNTLYAASRYTGPAGLANMYAAVSWFDVNSGNELLSLRSGSGLNGQSRTYTTSVVINQDEIYVLYRGDLNGTGTTDVSKVYLAKFTTSGQWIWGMEYDLMDYPGEYGMSLKQLDNDLIISGNGYGPRDLFALRVAKANGAVIWGKGYHNTNGYPMAFNLRGDQSMLVTNSTILLAAYVEPSPGQALPQLMSLNTAGDAAAGNCLEVYELTIETNELPVWTEMGLEPWPEPLGDITFAPLTDTMLFQLLTPCLDSCSTAPITEICDNGIDDDDNGLTDCEDPALALDCCCQSEPTVMLPGDTILCPGTPIVIRATITGNAAAYLWNNNSTADSLTIDSPGTYILTLTDSCGRLAADTIIIDYFDLIGPPELGPDLEVCDNGVLTLNAGSGYDSYLWSDFSTDSTITFFDPGIHWLRVTDQCGNTYTDTVRITVLPTTVLDLPQIIQLCPQDSQLITASGFATYTWFSDDIVNCENCAEITVQAPPLGDTVIYTLLVSNAAGCFSVDSTLVTTESLAGTSSMASICAGEQYDFNGMILTDPGIYTTPSLCGSTDTLILTVLANPPVVELSERICLGDSVFVFGAFRSTAGIFLDTMPSVEGCDSVRRFTLNVDSPALSTFDISICSGDSALIFGTFRKLPGAYSMTFPGTESACDSTATINLVVNDLPMPGIDIIAACGLPTASVNLTGINASTTINWNDPALSGPQVMLTEGDYILSLATAAGCTLDTVISVSIPPAVPVELDVINPLCPSGSDGYLRLLPPGTQSLIGINGGQPIVTDSIGGLSAGTYQVEILDTSGCQQIRTAEIQDPQAFQLLLPRDTIIRLGAKIQIIGRLFGIDPSEVILSWFPLDFLSCDSCLVVSTTPVNSITYELSATDTFGCTRLEDIRILVDKAPRIYVPNAFSPNGDGVNDLFFPNFATEVEEVEFMQIYERWGGQVYLRENFPPNDPAFGWDGTLNGEQLNPNVFVWHLRVRLVDGTVITKKGDLTLLR